MASNINATKPTTGSPTTQSVRDNFSAAKAEINSLLRSSLDVVSTSGTGTAYLANFSINVVKANGARVIVKAHTANTGGATINIDTTGASTIKNMDGSNLLAGQIAGPNHYIDLVYNSGNNTWVLMNPKVLEINKLSTARNIALTGNVTGNADFDGSANISISTSISASTALVAYPVGSIFTTTSDSFNPATTFGGTWSLHGGGKVLVGDNGAASYSVGQTGGSSTHDHSTTITRDGWGSDGVDLPRTTVDGRLVTGSGNYEHGENLESLTHASANKVFNSDSETSFPPYIVVKFWKRTA